MISYVTVPQQIGTNNNNIDDKVVVEPIDGDVPLGG